MPNSLILKARVRKRDHDIRQAVELLNLEEGEMADMVRDGFRKVLDEMGILKKPLVTPEIARMVAKELLQNFNTEG